MSSDHQTVHGVPIDVAKERLAKAVKEFEDPETVSWGWIEGRSLALARLELGDDPLPEDWQDYAEADDVRDVIQGEYDDYY